MIVGIHSPLGIWTKFRLNEHDISKKKKILHHPNVQRVSVTLKLFRDIISPEITDNSNSSKIKKHKPLSDSRTILFLYCVT